MIFFNDDKNEELNEVQEESSAETEETVGQDKLDCLNCKDFSAIKDSYIRLNADFENFKRRVQKDQINWVSAGQAKILLDMLPVVDDFDRALAEHEKEGHSEQLDSWLQGFEMIRKSLYKFLESNGVKKIEQVQMFDPELHEAVTQIEVASKNSGEVVDVIQQGFMFNDTVLRPAKVVVAK